MAATMIGEVARFVRKKQARQLLGNISTGCLDDLINSGRLKASKISHKVTLIDRSDIEALIEASVVRPAGRFAQTA